jgi:lipoprotein
MKQTQNTGNFACKLSIFPGFARLKNLLSANRARTITTMLAFFASIISLCFLQNPSFASLFRTPATYLNISTSTPNVDLQFNQSELSSSAFKTNSVAVSIQTDNTAGATTYISSVDEATSLVHSDSGVSDSIASISSPLLSTAFSGKTWGYRVGSLATTAFNPIPKVSAPAEILNTTSATPASNNLNIDFGVKVSPDLSSGTYSKQILFTSITNHLPTTATFLMGKTFNDRVTTYNTGKSVKNFKHSLTPPQNMGNAIVVSSPTSEKPIYLWHDSMSETDFWWTEADVAYANENMGNMFTQNLGSNHLDLVDLRGINTSKSNSAYCMFGCSGSYLFPGQTGIKMNISAIDFSEFDSSNILDMSYMFAGFNADFWGHCTNQANLDFSKINTSNVKNMKGMFSSSCVPNLRSLNFDTSKVEDMSEMFTRTNNGINELDLSSFDTRSLKTARSMFEGSNFTKINVSGWRNDALTDMFEMFASMYELTEINISNFRTNNVTDMSGTFKDDHKLRLLDLSSFNTNKVKSMASLFSGLYKVTNINLSSFDTSNVEDMGYMFYACAELASLNLNNFNTSKVTDMRNMFVSLNIPSLDLSSFNTARVTNMENMFKNMMNLTNLNLSSFDTSNVTNMNGMFTSSMRTSIRSILDLSSFNTNNLIQAKEMFYNMNVKTIYVSPNFNVNNVTNSHYMMNGLQYIVGGNGTTFSNSNPKDKTYARIDAPGTPGYFTQKP